MYNPSMMRVVTGLTIAAFFVASAHGAVTAEADEMLAQLSKIRLDKKQMYSIRDISIRRDVLSISFNRGAIAFTEAIDGKVTGAVFIGSGDILAIPPDRIEKQQLYRFTKSAILNEHFETAVLRFTDGTYDEILKEYRAHAIEDVDAEQIEQLLRWDSELQRRGRFLNDRILADLLATSATPLFLAQLEGAQLGWFDAVYDERRTEEVLIEQNVTRAEAPILWTSFNKRSEVKDAAANAHENKSLTDLVSYNVDGPTALLRLRARVAGEHIVEVPLAPPASIQSIASEAGQTLSFIENQDRVSVILPGPLRREQEVGLRITYAADAPRDPGFRKYPANGVSSASYRDQWLIDGFANYAASVTADGLERARVELLQPSPEGGSYESLGPVAIGYRMTQPRTTEGYAAALVNKSTWIVHMLRGLMRRGENDDRAFGALVAEFTDQFRGKAISTYDFIRLAEKHAGRELDWFFDQWVFGTGIPSYGVDYKVDAVSGGFAIEGRISQSGVPESFEMPVPLYADETLLGRVTVSGDDGEFRFVVKTRPQQIRVDPRGTVLAVVP